MYLGCVGGVEILAGVLVAIKPRYGAPYGMVAVSVLIWAGAAIVWKTRIQPKERA